VYSGALALGGLRESYATRLAVRINVADLPHGTPGTAAVNDVRDALREILASECNVFEEDVVMSVVSANNPLVFEARILVHDARPATEVASDWYTKKLGPAMPKAMAALRGVQNAVPGPAYGVGVMPPTVEKEADTADFDFTISGLDYSGLPEAKQQSFLRALAEGVRNGIDYAPCPAGAAPGAQCADVHNVVNQIRVKFNPDATKGSVRVSVAVPVPAGNTAPAIHARTAMMNRLSAAFSNGALQTGLQTSLRLVDGINMVTTWTGTNVQVTLPGNDL